MELTIGDRCIIIDAGSGLRHLGENLLIEQTTSRADLLLTHIHLDHICGLPFFCPAYSTDFELSVHSGHLGEGVQLMPELRRLFSPPVFPVDLNELSGLTTSEFRCGETLDLGDGIFVDTIGLNHPGGSVGYRFDIEGAQLAIITDHEHGDIAVDRAIARFVEGCDVMVYDATYTDSEYRNRVGWGHSTHERMLALASAAGVSRPVAFHHLPERSDGELDRIAALIDRRHPGALVAEEGMTLEVGTVAAHAQVMRA